MIDEKVLIDDIKQHKEDVVPSNALSAAIYALAHDHFVDIVKRQPKVGGWIPCSERLPDKEEYLKNDGRFIVTDGNRVYQSIYDRYIDHCFKTLRFKNLQMDSPCYQADNCVIAWMPLPEPYDANAEAEKPQWQQQMMDRFLKGE